MIKTRKQTESCVCYYRVSSDMQRDSKSIMRQEKLVPGLVKRLGLTVLQEFRDDGISGKTVKDRPAMRELLDGLPKLQPDYICFMRPDRLGRPEDRDALKALLDAACENKVDLAYVEEDSWTGELAPKIVHHNSLIETHQLEGELIRAGLENKRRGRDVRQGKFVRLMRGLWPFTGSPYGFRWSPDEKCFVPMKEEIKRLRWMFKQVADGKGAPTIATELRRQKVLTPHAAKFKTWGKTLANKIENGDTRWTQGVVRKLLGQEYYTGVYRYSMEKYSDLLKAYRSGKRFEDVGDSKLTADEFIEFRLVAHDGEPTISKKLFDKAQQSISSRRRRGNQLKGVQKHFLFGPWIKCSCGMGYCIRNQTRKHKDGKVSEFRYYYCRNRRSETTRDGQPYCSTPPMRADDIDDKLWNILLSFLSKPTRLLDKWLQQQKGETTDANELRRLIKLNKKEITKHGHNNNKWLDLYGEDAIDKKELTKRSGQEKAEIERLQAENTVLQRRLDAVTTKPGDMEKTRKVLKQFEKRMAVGTEIRKQLDGLNWNQRRAFLHNIIGLTHITLTHLPLASVRSIIKRRHGYGAKGIEAAGEFIEQFCVDPEKEVFIKGIALPLKPLQILDSMAAVGIRPEFYTQTTSTGGRCSAAATGNTGGGVLRKNLTPSLNAGSGTASSA